MSELADTSVGLSSVLSWVIFGTKVVGTLVVGLGFLLYANQDRLLYFPNPPGMPATPNENPVGCVSPAEWTVDGKHETEFKKFPGDTRSVPESIPFIEEFVITPDGFKLHTWLLLQPNLNTSSDSDSSKYPTLIYFHGNAGNMGYRLINAVQMYARVKMNILMMDYRGYGNSTGTPNERGLQIDGEAVLKYAKAHPKLKNSPIILFGRSLGGGVCFYLAERFPELISGIIVENTFLSIGAMVDVIMPFVKWLKPLVLAIKWNSDEKIQHVSHPIMFISGDSDELVPPFHMKQLYDLAVKSKHREFYSVSGGGHNDTWDRAGKQYYRKMLQFVEDWILQTSTSTTTTTTTTKSDEEEENAAATSSTTTAPEVKTTTHTAEENSNESSSKSACTSFHSAAPEDINLFTHMETVAEDTAPPPSTPRRESPTEDEDEDYLILSKSASLPTMDKNFQIHH